MKPIKILCKKLINFEFTRFFLVGGITTLLDWSIFYILAIVFGLFYQFALISGFVIAGITHYNLNKIFTFKCKSRKIIKQFSIFISVAIIILFLSMAIMYFLVGVAHLNKMISRVMTTGIAFFINYLLHKNLTFNKKLFIREGD